MIINNLENFNGHKNTVFRYYSIDGDGKRTHESYKDMVEYIREHLFEHEYLLLNQIPLNVKIRTVYIQGDVEYGPNMETLVYAEAVETYAFISRDKRGSI